MVCGEMKNRVLKIGLSIGIIILFSGVSIAAVGIQLSESNQIKLKDTKLENIDMLIFLSPQYKDDIDILNSIDKYISVKNEDIGWNIKIIKIEEKNNYYEEIDKIIEKYYDLYDLKSCLMVGEDTDTLLSSDIDYIEKISIVPWYTIGGQNAYEISEQGIINKPYKMDICISILYPTSTLDYETKKSQIIFSFEKFIDNTEEFNNKISVFESSDLNKESKKLYQKLSKYSDLDYIEDPTDKIIIDSLDDSYLMYCLHGHSNPSGTNLNKVNGWFSADELDDLKTPFFAADGCYVSGWWSDNKDNNELDSSIDGIWYGSKIFSSKYIKVMALGLLSQNGYSFSVNFIDNVIPDLYLGKTLAESMIDNYFVGDNVIIFGDPTISYIN